MSRVLVTAGFGSIGRAVVDRLLASNHVAVVLDARTMATQDQGIVHLLARSTDSKAVRDAAHDCDHILHLEWSGSVHRTTQEPLETNRHNTTSMLNVLETAREFRIPVTFASTSVYRGDSPGPVAEDGPRNERSLYVAQKLYAEACLRSYALMFGLSGCSLRIFNVYGAEGAPFQIIPRIRHAIRNQTGIQLTGDGGQIRDFIHVQDVAEAVVRTVGTRLEGEAYNVGTGRGTSMLELIRLAEKVTGVHIPLEMVPAKGEEARYLVANPTRSDMGLGFRATTKLEDGLRAILT
ncbi:MAG: NAD-dependent epimerase/dehydratase family protein [Fimbriimonas sp.]|nr:NAD-dependent epimerase/dehydratase family protein [Fimbriimonas sp.]